MLLLSQIFVVIDARSFNNQANENNKRFIRINIPIISSTDSCNYYPINTGDFWEYIEKDTTTLLGQFYFGLNFSVTREVLKDTLFDNGKIYKQIKWENVANSVNYEPRYEYHRIDSTGKVYLNYSNQDYLLFDFTLPIGQTYSAHIPNHFWLLSDKYYVIGFGDTLHAVDFKLYEAGNIIKETYTLVENFGITNYRKALAGYGFPEGNFWGAVVNGIEYGTSIVNKHNVDWKEFYPLQLNNYWVYTGQGGSTPTLTSKRVISDTVLSDGNKYYKSNNIDHTFGYASYSYERIDSLGKIYSWQYWNNKIIKVESLSIAVGDTSKNPLSASSIRRVNDKYINGNTETEEIHIFSYPDLTYSGKDYCNNFGLFRSTADLSWSELKGCYINGILWGDTIITNISDSPNLYLEKFRIIPCYPNPFNSSTKISWQSSVLSHTTIKIYDILGMEIAELVNEEKPAGVYEIEFNSDNYYLSSGVYIYTINAVSLEGNGKTFAKSSKLMLMK